MCGTPRSAVSKVPTLYVQPPQLPPRPTDPPMGKHVETAEGRFGQKLVGSRRPLQFPPIPQVRPGLEEAG